MKNYFVLLPLIFILNSCNEKKQSENILRFRLPTETPTNDWNFSVDNVSKDVFAVFVESLVMVDAAGVLQNRLAESWSKTADGKEYTFKIRPNAKWSDGVSVTAQNFVDGWERLLNPKNASPYSYFLFDIVGAQDYGAGKSKDFKTVSVIAVDALTLKVKLRKPVAFWAYIPSFAIAAPIRKDLIDKYGDRWTEPGKIQSAGPYNLSVHERDSKMIFERNKFYYDQETLQKMPEKVEFRVVKEDNTAVALIDNKNLDIVRDLPPLQIPTLSTRKDFLKLPYLRGTYIGLTFTHDPNGPVGDVRVRRALAMAIDREEIAKVLGPIAIADSSWVPPGLLANNPARGIKYDPVGAKKLWDEIKVKPAKIDYWFDQKERNRLVAELIQNQWKKTLGLDSNLQTVEWKVYLKQLQSHTPPVYRYGWGADYQDPDTFMNLFTCDSGQNESKFCDKAYDKLINEAAVSQDDKFRSQAYDQAQKILLEDKVGIIPIYFENNLFLVSQRVEGYHTNLMGDFIIRDIRLK